MGILLACARRDDLAREQFRLARATADVTAVDLFDLDQSEFDWANDLCSSA